MPFHMRVPKLKGFTNPFRIEYQVVNLDQLAALFPDGGDVDPEVLVERARSARASWSRFSAPARSVRR